MFLLFNILYIINTNFLQPRGESAPAEAPPSLAVLCDAGYTSWREGVLLKKEAYFYNFVF